MYKNIIFNWSGGKDSAFALHQLIRQNQHDILCLLTSVNQKYDRVSMHGVRRELLHEQAKQLKIPLVEIKIPENILMEDYNELMKQTLQNLIKKRANAVAFGDIFLEDLRSYREKQLEIVNLKGIFPLWKIPTHKLANDFIHQGFKTIVTCVNEKYLDQSFVGRVLDAQFLSDLPKNVDPCGEHGEFHTFVFDAPIFDKPISFTKGKIVYRKYNTTHVEPDTGFWFCDLIPS